MLFDLFDNPILLFWEERYELNGIVLKFFSHLKMFQMEILDILIFRLFNIKRFILKIDIIIFMLIYSYYTNIYCIIIW